MIYETPHVVTYGSVLDLTAKHNDIHGNDECKKRGPHTFKQTGEADDIHSQGPDSLMSCSP